MRYTKKPVTIEAMQWDGSYESREAILKAFPRLVTASLAVAKNETRDIMFWSIKTLEGEHVVAKNDFVIQGVEGEYYPCKPSIFEKTYDKAKE